MEMEEDGLPNDWEQKTDPSSGHVYYYIVLRGRSSWTTHAKAETGEQQQSGMESVEDELRKISKMMALQPLKDPPPPPLSTIFAMTSAAWQKRAASTMHGP
jgi:hypothetical protein